jgi:hypothetical protein
MKPFDIKGEYSPGEVKAALAGISGTRQLSYRYERLDRYNNYVEDIDYIQSCSIENNGLADIKRTAKFDILDTGSINYLQDRIKPYVRLAMPADETYSDYVKTLDPMYWWKMDDPIKTVANTAPVTVADAVNYNTRGTAYVAPNTAGAKTRPVFSLQTGSGSVRSEFWMSYNVVNSDALILNMKKGTGQMSFEIYYSTSTTDSLTLVTSREVTGIYAWVHRIPFPKIGYYWVRMTTTSSTLSTGNYVETYRPARLEDSSGHGVYGTGNDYITMKASAIIADGGTSLSTPLYSSPSWGASDLLPLGLKNEGGFSVNFWDHTTTANQYTSVGVQWGFEQGWAELVRTTEASNLTTIRLYVNSYDTNVLPNFDSSAVPLESLKYTAGTGHMTTLTLDPVKGFRLYIDSVEEVLFPNVLAGGSTNVEAFAPLFDDTLDYVSTSAYSDSAIKFDDMSTYNRALTTQQVSALYSKALTSTPDRSGYVEWPQGVFVLSSPSRKMVNGNQVVRAVDGYDQLVVLKEDSFDYRYSVDQGTTYTDAIEKVLQTTLPYETFSLNDKRGLLYQNENTSNTVNVLTDDSFNVVSTGDNFVWGIVSGQIFSFTDLSVQAKVVGPTGATDYQTYIKLEAFPDGVTKTYGMYLEETGLLRFFDGYSVISITYNPTTHAYWRIRESKGYVYFETSPDSVTWTQQRVVKLDYDILALGRVLMVQAANLSGATTTFSKIKVQGYTALQKSIVRSTSTLPSVMEWEPGTPKLTIINDLLGSINYESASYDEDGLFVGRPYITPQNRTSQFGYATDSESVISGDVGQTMDLFAVPNKWVVVVSEPDRPAIVGTYVNDDPLSPTSTVARGRTIVDFRTEQNAPDQATLDAQAERLAFEASQVYEVIEFNTAIMPIHQNMDVYDLTIDGLEIASKYAEQSWKMTLSNGATMTHRVRKVVSV